MYLISYIYNTKQPKQTPDTMEVYFSTQSAAIQTAFEKARKEKYEVDEPTYIWTQHVGYGESVSYHLPLIVKETGNPAKKWLHFTLYRFESGTYELTSYIL